MTIRRLFLFWVAIGLFAACPGNAQVAAPTLDECSHSFVLAGIATQQSSPTEWTFNVVRPFGKMLYIQPQFTGSWSSNTGFRSSPYYPPPRGYAQLHIGGKYLLLAKPGRNFHLTVVYPLLNGKIGDWDENQFNQMVTDAQAVNILTHSFFSDIFAGHPQDAAKWLSDDLRSLEQDPQSLFATIGLSERMSFDFNSITVSSLTSDAAEVKTHKIIIHKRDSLRPPSVIGWILQYKKVPVPPRPGLPALDWRITSISQVDIPTAEVIGP
jgi:hypothetical protein